MPRLELEPDEEDPQRPVRKPVDTERYWWRCDLADAYPSPGTYALARRWLLSQQEEVARELDRDSPGWREDGWGDDNCPPIL